MCLLYLDGMAEPRPGTKGGLPPKGVARSGPATALPWVLNTTTRTSYSTPFTRNLTVAPVPSNSPADSQLPSPTRRNSTLVESAGRGCR